MERDLSKQKMISNERRWYITSIGNLDMSNLTVLSIRRRKEGQKRRSVQSKLKPRVTCESSDQDADHASIYLMIDSRLARKLR